MGRLASELVWFSMSLVACGRTTGEPAPATDSVPSASSAASPPALVGPYRVEAVLAFNEKAIAGLGSKRRSFEDLTRDTMKGGKLVTVRFLITFNQDNLVVRNDMLFRGDGDDSYTFAWCEARGAAEWKGKTLVVPAEISTKGRGGSYWKTKHSFAGCDANLADGAHQLVQEGNEIFLRMEKGGWIGGLLLVRDEGTLDVEGKAKELAGNESK